MDYTIETIKGKQYKVYPNGRKSPHVGDAVHVQQTGLSTEEMIEKSGNKAGDNTLPAFGLTQVESIKENDSNE